MMQTTVMLQFINTLKSPHVVLGTPCKYDCETGNCRIFRINQILEIKCYLHSYLPQLIETGFYYGAVAFSLSFAL